MMNDRQKNYRQEYRSRLSSWYNGPVHVVVVYTIGLTALWIFSQHLHDVQWWEWALVPLFLIGANIFEWYLHLNVMHRPQKSKALRAIYNRHTLQHHQFFTDNEMRFRDHKDWRVTVFPPYAIVVLILIVIPGATLIPFCTHTEYRLVIHFNHYQHLFDLRIHAFLLSHRGELVRPQHAFREYDSASSHRPSQFPLNDGKEHESHFSHLRLVIRDLRSRSRFTRSFVQWL